MTESIIKQSSLFDQSIIKVTASAKKVIQVFSGLIFPNSSVSLAGPGRMEVYERVTVPVTFVVGTLAANITTNARVTRLDDQVTVVINPFFGIKAADGILGTGVTPSGPIPARMRPVGTNNPRTYCRCVFGAISLSCEISINAAGHIIIGIIPGDGNIAPSFSGSVGAVIGLSNQTSITYTVV